MTVLITGIPEYKYASVLIIFLTYNKLIGFLSVLRLRLHEQVYNVIGVHKYSNISNPGNRSSEPCNRNTETIACIPVNLCNCDVRTIVYRVSV